MAELDDDGTTDGEAEAQRVETVMPWIWGAIGLLVIAAFVAIMVLTEGHAPPNPPQAAPVLRPLGRSY